MDMPGRPSDRAAKPRPASHVRQAMSGKPRPARPRAEPSRFVKARYHLEQAHFIRSSRPRRCPAGRHALVSTATTGWRDWGNEEYKIFRDPPQGSRVKLFL